MAKKTNVIPFETTSAQAKPFVDVVMAAKGMWDHVIEMGLATPEDLRYQFTRAARKEVAQKLAAEGMSTREIAKVTGASPSQVSRDLRESSVPNGTSSVPNGTDDDIKDATVDERLAAARAKMAAASGDAKTTRELLGQSDQNDWRTPRKFLDAAREVMGEIDLDPATSVEANETVKAKKIYVQADNGLMQPWKGRVWLNPPYGGDARLFVDRLIKEYQVGNVTAACCLVNSHPTETKWFQQLFAYAICFVAGRIDFGGPSRAVSSTSTHGSAIAYLGADVDNFNRQFSQFGAVIRKV